jgi:hypothetical protein
MPVACCSAAMHWMRRAEQRFAMVDGDPEFIPLPG